ncbi:hypothetical protein C0J52_06559 [Blattella germanica]|nr:hypothetical protein C0J52_06559 [Blattella germanica]
MLSSCGGDCFLPCRDMKEVVCALMRALFVVGGFHWVTVRGKQASAKDAPILALAPHSTYFDALPVVFLGAPSVVAKGETGHLPFFGSTTLKLNPWICALGKSTYSAGGMTITVKGRQASRQEAPILVVAPHSTFLDAGITYVTGFPSIIVRRESGLNPFIGKLINYTQPVYVWREDPNSRQNTIKEIIDRATSKQDWPQVLIFPEGTCTNRSCLITFKPGAFYPGVPIQPVCIRYPNKLDTVTWTWEGPGALTHTNIEEKILKQSPHIITNEGGQVSYKEFARRLDVPSTSETLQQLFRLYDKDCTGIIDFREYLLGVLVISKASNASEMVELAFKVNEFIEYAKKKSEYSHFFRRRTGGGTENKTNLKICDYSNGNYKTKPE